MHTTTELIKLLRSKKVTKIVVTPEESITFYVPNEWNTAFEIFQPSEDSEFPSNMYFLYSADKNLFISADIEPEVLIDRAIKFSPVH